MRSNDKIEFLTSKIRHLETALLHIHSDGLLKLPATIVQTLLVDDAGHIWFAVNKPLQEINEFDKSFYVGLNYYRKGTPFFLNTYGLARLVTDPKELADLPQELQRETANNRVLINVKILNATYYEQETELSDTWYNKCKHFIKSIFAFNEDNILNFEDGLAYPDIF